MDNKEQELFAKHLDLLLKQLYKQHFDRLYNTAISYIVDEGTAQEIINASFLNVLAELSKLLNASNVAGMLDNFTRKGCQAYLQHKEMYTNEEHSFPKKTKHFKLKHNEQLSENEDLYAIVRDAVKRLPQQRKAIILYLYWEGLTTDQIATKMGLARQTVLNQKNKALHRLKSVMSKYLI